MSKRLFLKVGYELEVDKELILCLKSQEAIEAIIGHWFYRWNCQGFHSIIWLTTVLSECQHYSSSQELPLETFYLKVSFLENQIF